MFALKYFNLQKLDFSRYSVLGWCNGGVTGANLAADFPDRITKLVTWGAHSFADERSLFFSKSMHQGLFI